MKKINFKFQKSACTCLPLNKKIENEKICAYCCAAFNKVINKIERAEFIQ